MSANPVITTKKIRQAVLARGYDRVRIGRCGTIFARGDVYNRRYAGQWLPYSTIDEVRLRLRLEALDADETLTTHQRARAVAKEIELERLDR